jgi:hypothetical protein
MQSRFLFRHSRYPIKGAQKRHSHTKVISCSFLPHPSIGLGVFCAGFLLPFDCLNSGQETTNDPDKQYDIRYGSLPTRHRPWNGTALPKLR